ncbi:MAG: 4Fe-4S cluster-binding domain-containing protein [Clostridia bacterium]|nr:4Fe-4S cluster-binding domain-containing protein [Clostridia bacterium]
MKMKCNLCPRNCGAEREKGEKGFCGESSAIRAAQAALYYGEEPCISGSRGSGNVFFSGCSLHCVYCQNQPISSGQIGRVLSSERLAWIFLNLQEQKAHNLNLVTAGHFLPLVAKALELAKKQGLSIPVVYNTSAYEKTESLALLQGLIDIYLPDLKYFSPVLSQKYSRAADYFFIAAQALAEMFRQTGKACFDSEGILQRGMLVRHLLLPGQLEDSKKVVEYLWRTYGNSIWLSLMNQYTPLGNLAAFPELQKPVSPEEYQELLDYALDLGITQAFIQEDMACGLEYIPAFDLSGL